MLISVFYVHGSTCGGYQHGVWTAPDRCGRPVVAAGIVIGPDQPSPAVWLAFTCAEHAGALDVARPLAERDRVEIARRRCHEQARRPNPDAGPLARGRAARELVDRARCWAAAHPDQTYTPPRCGPSPGPDRPV